MTDLDITLTTLWLSKSCNVGLVPVIKPDVPALTRAGQAYWRADNIAAGNGRLIEAQTSIDIAGSWGGGLMASADGLGFVVQVQTIHAGPNPHYFGIGRGATWLGVVNDQVMGISGVVIPGTLRDSLFILDAIHNRDGELKRRSWPPTPPPTPTWCSACSRSAATSSPRGWPT